MHIIEIIIIAVFCLFAVRTIYRNISKNEGCACSGCDLDCKFRKIED